MVFKKKIMEELGITDHIDDGLVDGCYQERVYIDKEVLCIRLDKKKVDESENPAAFRFENMRKLIAERLIKPCPFCGGVAEICHGQRRHDNYKAVECTNCGVFIAGCNSVEKWNNRVGAV